MLNYIQVRTIKDLSEESSGEGPWYFPIIFIVVVVLSLYIAKKWCENDI